MSDRLNVRCCCQPQKILGTLPAPGVSAVVSPRPRSERNDTLPKRWAWHRGVITYRVPLKERRYWNGRSRIRLGETLEEARQAFKLLHPSTVASAVPRIDLWKYVDNYHSSCKIPLGMLQGIYASARSGAAARALAFELLPVHVVFLALRAAGACMLTGIAWDYAPCPRTGRRAWIPSLDRIDSQKGYVIGNVRLVCAAVNIALNAFGDEVLMRIARAMTQHRKRR